MERRFIVLACLTVVAACSGAAETTGGKAGETGALAQPQASAPPPEASAPQPRARHEKIENALIDFDYAYPAPAAAIPALSALLEADMMRQKQELLPQARSMQKEAKENGFEFHPLGYWVEWQVVTDLPGWLSLSTQVGTYEGGAHPNYYHDTILWDRQAGRRRTPVSLFVSAAALDGAIRTDFCRQLDSQRKDKRQGDAKLGGGVTEFDACIAPLENTLILGSSNGRAFDRLGILIAPYQAGPYAEGSYEVTLPITPAVLAAVKPEYRSVFATGR